MPIETKTWVQSVQAEGQGYRVQTNRGSWKYDNVVLANGACAIPRISEVAASIPPDILQLSPLSYRRSTDVPDGRVLVVGASGSWVQIAEELRGAGRDVILSASQHDRVPRRYRDRDIQWWMDQIGVLVQCHDEVDDLGRARSVSSLQLVGRVEIPLVNLNYLQARGTEVTGRLAAIRDGKALLSGGLANACTLADLKMRRLLRIFDDWAGITGLKGLPAPDDFVSTQVCKPYRLSLDLTGNQIRSNVWATRFRADVSWLDLPVFDSKGRLAHQGGIVARGHYVLRQPFQRRRKLEFLDGVGADTIALSDHLIRKSGCMAA